MTATCIRRGKFRASLKLGKRYRVIPDALAESFSCIRIIDESRESYLYPKSYFFTKRKGIK